MPDWGAIGGANAAAGFLNGFTQSYVRENARKAELAAHQEGRLLDLYAQAIQADPTITTNPGFYAGMQASGLPEEAVGTLTALGQLIATQPATQQADAQRQFLGKMRAQIMDRYGSAAGPSMDPASMTPTEGFFVGGAPLSQAIHMTNSDTGGGLTPYQQQSLDLREQREGRLAGEQERKRKLGVVEERQTPVGPRKVRVVPDPATGSATVTPLGGVKQSPGGEAVTQNMATINTGLRIANKLAATLNQRPEKMAKLFTPFVGKTLVELANNVGALDPEQKQFVLRLMELRNQRLNMLGGKALTETEERLYNQTLPSDLNTVIGLVPTTVQHVLETLTTSGANLEAATEQAGKRAPKTAVLPYNRDFYKHVRRTSKHAYRHAQQVPLNPGETLGVGGDSAPAPGAAATDDDALNRAFLGE